MAMFAAPVIGAITSAFSTAGAGAAASAAALETGLAATTVSSAGIAGAGGGLFSSLASGASYAASVLQGTAGLVGAMSALRSGREEAKAARLKADDALFDAKSEQINSLNRQTGLRGELVKALGERDAATASSGGDMSFGTPSIAREEAINDANKALTQDQNVTDMRVARLREKSSQLIAMGEEAKRGARAKAFGLGLMSLGSIIKRG